MAKFRTLDDVDPSGRRVVIRLDLNVPVENGRVSDATRIERALGTIRELLDREAAVVILSHFGRPKGKAVVAMSLAPIAEALGRLLGRDVAFIATDWRDDRGIEEAARLKPGELAVMENTRFHPGEETNDRAFAARLARLGDLYVNDAFSAAHRAHASTEGIAHILPACAGRAMEAELRALEMALGSPERPVIAVIGGAKISTKLDLLGSLSQRVDAIVIGGGMANTFLAALGRDVGKSLCEHDLLDTARETVAVAKSNGCDIILPVDVVVAEVFEAGAPHRIASVDDVRAGEMILDIGPATAADLKHRFEAAKTLVWNGPLGAFEIEPFDHGTSQVARIVGDLSKAGALRSIAGGGDTVAALNKAGAAGDFTYVSTAGGAFLEWLEGKVLPGVRILTK